MALSIFIVEDNHALRASLTAALGELPHTDVIGAAGTEVESLTWLVSNPDDWSVVLIDLFLREGNGLGVLAGCRVRKAAQKLVVLTNYATPEMRRRCLGLGADAVFDKTSEIEQMLKYIRGLNR
ncbi:MAG: response regulator [Pseudomonadota bacterium]